MKKALILIIVVAFAFGVFIANNAQATVKDTYHDFSTNSATYATGTAARYAGLGAQLDDVLGTTSTQMCVFCHHPHRSTGTGMYTNEVLWNQVDQSAAYAVYNSDSIDGSIANVSSGNGMRSYICLACHDGDIATGALVAAPGDGTNITVALTLIGGKIGAGNNLEDDHPVNITFANGTDSGLSDNIINSAVDELYPLYNNTIQCATCHDVHNAADTNSTGVQFMRILGWEENSAICTACHTNK